MEQLQNEKIVDKINRNAGWIDPIDAFELVSAYTDKFGIIYTTLSIEEELALMYYRLKGYEIFEEDFTDRKTKKCLKCKIEHRLTLFGKNYNQRDGRSCVCKLCLRKDPEEAHKKYAENELKKKYCPSCRRTYNLNQYASSSSICGRCKNKNKENESKKPN